MLVRADICFIFQEKAALSPLQTLLSISSGNAASLKVHRNFSESSSHNSSKVISAWVRIISLLILPLQLLLQSIKEALYLFFRPAFLVDTGNSFFKIYPRFNTPNTSSLAPNTPAEKLKFLVKKLINSSVCGIFYIKKVYNNNIMLLVQYTGTTDPLLIHLRIPW